MSESEPRPASTSTGGASRCASPRDTRRRRRAGRGRGEGDLVGHDPRGEADRLRAGSRLGRGEGRHGAAAEPAARGGDETGGWRGAAAEEGLGEETVAVAVDDEVAGGDEVELAGP